MQKNNFYKEEKEKLRNTPLTQMSNKLLSTYINDFIASYDKDALSQEEKVLMFNALWNSTIYMKLKCMTQAERDKYYADKKKNKQIKKDVSEYIKSRKHVLKTRHLYV